MCVRGGLMAKTVAKLGDSKEVEFDDPGSWHEESHLPIDVVHQIVTILSERDTCSLGRCSRYWHAICSSDVVWFHLFHKRWASTSTATAIFSSRHLRGKDSPKRRLCDCMLIKPCSVHNLFKQHGEGWQAAYRNSHVEMRKRARAVVELIKARTRHESVEVADYQKGLMMLSTTGLALYDVFLFLFTSAQSVLVNLIGLHYCLFHLGAQGAELKELKEFLARSKVGERKVCLRWWSMGGWANGFRRRDEMQIRMASIANLTEPESVPLFQILDRGTLHEVLRVQISADFESSAWVQRDMHSQR